MLSVVDLFHPNSQVVVLIECGKYLPSLEVVQGLHQAVQQSVSHYQTFQCRVLVHTA